MRRALRTVFPDAEYLTVAKKEYLVNDTAEDLLQPMRAAFPSFDGDVLLHHALRFVFPKS